MDGADKIMQRIQIGVEGRVQGVCFRMYTREEAVRLGLKGWVRNRADGSVEIVAEGDEGALQCLVEWCRQGSPYSSVEDVSFKFMKAMDEFDSFVIR